jgi:hypothetical protein
VEFARSRGANSPLFRAPCAKKVAHTREGVGERLEEPATRGRPGFFRIERLGGAGSKGKVEGKKDGHCSVGQKERKEERKKKKEKRKRRKEKRAELLASACRKCFHYVTAALARANPLASLLRRFVDVAKT